MTSRGLTAKSQLPCYNFEAGTRNSTMNDSYQRHGIFCDSRKCPRHHQAMEIATDNNSAEFVSSILQWWWQS